MSLFTGAKYSKFYSTALLYSQTAIKGILCVSVLTVIMSQHQGLEQVRYQQFILICILLPTIACLELKLMGAGYGLGKKKMKKFPSSCSL